MSAKIVIQNATDKPMKAGNQLDNSTVSTLTNGSQSETINLSDGGSYVVQVSLSELDGETIAVVGIWTNK